MKKVLRLLVFLFIFASGLLLLVGAYGSWRDQQLFSHGQKEKTIATIQVDQHLVKTYHYPQNDYGVDASQSAWRDGDEVTVYFLKEHPFMVAENPYIYHAKSDILLPIIYALMLFGLGALALYNPFLFGKSS